MTISGSEFERKLNAEFRQFADSLKASHWYLKKGVQKCEHVRHFIEKSGRKEGISIAKFLYGGSIGKHVDVQKPDFDIIIKINNHTPPFTNVLQFLSCTLQRHASQMAIDPKSVTVTPFTVRFTFLNGMPVDLLPAVANMTDEQVIQKIRQCSGKNRRYWSSSLVESQIRFLRQQSAFVHSVARLSKFWFKSMDFNGAYISGGSLMFELLSVAAVEIEMEADRPGPESIIYAFYRVVCSVESLKNIELAFERNGSLAWVVSSRRIDKHQIPYILEPANPTNNLLEGMSEHVFERFRRNAVVMKSRLKNLLQRQVGCTVRKEGEKVKVDVDLDRWFGLVR